MDENYAVAQLPTSSTGLSSTPAQRFDSTPLFMMLAAGLLAGAIIGWPHLDYSPNDASRWNTIYFLVEHGIYEIKPDHAAEWPGLPDKRIDINTVPAEKRADLFEVDGNYYASVADMPLFYTIDVVRNRKDGKYYSSKPPLLPTLIAGVVLGIETITGADFRKHPRFIMRTTLIIAQAIPLLIFIWLASRIILRSTASPFIQHFSIAAASLATYLTAWSCTLNNHVIAASSAMIALYALIRIWYDQRRQWYWFVLAGFFGSFTAANEFPAALLAAALMLAVWMKEKRKTLLWAVPFALLPVAASLITNYLAVGSFKPVYADYGKIGGAYDYPGSYWPPRGTPSGIDALNEPWHLYMFNILIGHHGFFLLTPIFLISLVGVIRELRRGPQTRPMLAILTIAMTVAIACFYTLYTTESKNYGGTAQGARWMFWLIPLWVIFLPAGLECFARAWPGRVVSYLFLAVSMTSVGCAFRQPWGASWAHFLFREMDWIKY